MNMSAKYFWNSHLEEIKRGYLFDKEKEEYTCILCGEIFRKGEIYQVDSRLYDAPKAAEIHLVMKHSSMFDYLLGLDKKYTGLTEQQKKLLILFYQGLSDKVISKESGLSMSTVRNYRFSFKEKEKQAKVVLALMELLTEKNKDNDNDNDKDSFVDIPPSAVMVDERFATTAEEYQDILKKYFNPGTNGTLKGFPKQQKKKLVILQELLKRFDQKRKYTEKEINQILQGAYHDYVTIRRYLVDYGFLNRNPDGSLYWVK